MARSTKNRNEAKEAAPSTRGFIPPQTDVERFFMRHIEDMAHLVQKRGMVRYSEFLSDREQMLAKAAVPKSAGVSLCFVGGMPNTERKILCLAPEGFESDILPPLACVCITAKLAQGATPPQHKDYLGSLMGLSFDRACIGDIFLPEAQPGVAYVFVHETVLSVVLQEITSIGRTSVTVQEIALDALPSFAQQERPLQSTTVPSLRLDAVLAAMLRCSRGMASDYVAAGRVEINHVPVSSVHASVYEQDIFTVRGKGRFQLVSLQGKSKKDRFIIEYFQF